MRPVYLDTNALVTLREGKSHKLSAEARRKIDTGTLLISPMVFLEIEYIFRRKRVNANAQTMLLEFGIDLGLALCQLPFPAVAMRAAMIDWTQDPFDRIIVAQAMANNNAPLVTRDLLIRENYSNAIW